MQDIILVHGLFLTSRSWQPWVERYEARGLRVHAYEWPGLGSGDVAGLRADPGPLKRLDIAAVLEDLVAFARGFEEPPIVIGHSFGGLFAQLLAYRGFGSAIVGIHATAPAGVLRLPFSTLRAGAPVLANPFNIGEATMLSPEQFHYAFTNTLSREESQPYYDRLAIPCANRILFEGAFENFALHSPARIDPSVDRAPVLLVSSDADHLVTKAYVRDNVELISSSPGLTAHREYAGRPHLTTALPGWEQLADDVLDWALEPHLTPAS